MTVNEFFADIRRIVKRGNSMDADFPQAFKSALNFIEQNYNWRYMLQKRAINVVEGDSATTLLDADGFALKSVKQLGYLSGADWKWLSHVDPDELMTNDGNVPEGFILLKANGGWTFEFDTSWKENVELALYGYFYTVWDGDLTQDDIWLLNNARAAVEARMIINLAASMRDTTLMQMYNQLWMEAITVLVQEDGERVQGSR